MSAQVSTRNVGGAYVEPPSRWINSQSVAFGAALLDLFSEPTIVQQDDVLGRLGNDFTALNAGIELNPDQLGAYKAKLCSLPPSVLEAMANIDHSKLGDWQPHTTIWNQTLAGLRASGRISSAKLIADRMTSGTLAPAQIVRIAQSMTGAKWQDYPRFTDSIPAVRSALRERHATSQTRLRALEEVRAYGVPPGWDAVENVLLQRLYTWLLLVLSFDGNRRKSFFPLPVALDVAFDGLSCIHWPAESHRAAFIDHEGWNASFEQALQGAKKFWLSKRRFWPQAFIEMILSASVLVDLSAADDIVRPFATEIWGSNGHFSVADRSLETSLTLSILGKFFNAPAAMETVCSTGWLSDEIPDAGGRANYHVEPSRFVGPKVSCAVRTFYSDKFLTRERPEDLGDTKHLRICLGETLGDFADHVFRQRWRHHRYVRCPDISLAFKKHWTAGRDEAEIARVKGDLIYRNRQAVLILPPEIKGASTAQALYEISRKAERGKQTEEEKSKTGAHFAFVRAVADETNERFWQTVWEVLGGEQDEFEHFQFCVSTTGPARALATLLNKFSPTREDPRRAPDVLVIFGAKHLNQDGYRIPHGPFARLQLDRIIDELNEPGVLVPTPNQDIRKSIHGTRVIIVPEGWDETELPGGETFEVAAQGLHPGIMPLVERLSIFRHGFLHHHARRLLNISEGECDRIMAWLQNEPSKGGHVLAIPDGAREYLLKARRRLRPTVETASLHLEAACAIAGFLRPHDDAARFDYQEALSPVWLHEAQWHLSEAMRLCKAGTNDAQRSIFQEAQAAHYKLTRIGEPFGWSRVRWSATHPHQGAEDAIGALHEHLRAVQTSQVTHPLELVWSAKLIFRFSEIVRNDQNQAERYQQLSRTWPQLMRRAHEDSAFFDHRWFSGINEGDACRFVVATSHASMLLSRDPNGDGLSNAALLISRAIALEGSAVEIIDDKWFEFLGDREYSPFHAALEYRKGIFNQRFMQTIRFPRKEIIVKYLGALREMRRDAEPEIIEHIRKLSYGDRHFLHSDPRAARSGLWQLEHVANRWSLGRDELRRYLVPQPRTQQAA